LTNGYFYLKSKHGRNSILGHSAGKGHGTSPVKELSLTGQASQAVNRQHCGQYLAAEETLVLPRRRPAGSLDLRFPCREAEISPSEEARMQVGVAHTRAPTPNLLFLNILNMSWKGGDSK